METVGKVMEEMERKPGKLYINGVEFTGLSDATDYDIYEAMEECK